jgi:hypothetical protein
VTGEGDHVEAKAEVRGPEITVAALTPPLKRNAAGRVHSVLRALAESDKTGNANLGRVLLAVLGIPPAAGKVKSTALRILLDLRDEIDAAVLALHVKGVESSLYAEAVKVTRDFLAPEAVTTKWVGYRETLHGSVVHAFGFAAELLGDMEPAVTPEELDDLMAELSSVRTAVDAQTSLDPIVANFLRTNLDRMESALRAYPLRGGSVVVEARRTIVGSVVVDAPADVSGNARKLVERLGAVVQKFLKVADGVEKTAKLYERLKSTGIAALEWWNGSGGGGAV